MMNMVDIIGMGLVELNSRLTKVINVMFLFGLLVIYGGCVVHRQSKAIDDLQQAVTVQASINETLVAQLELQNDFALKLEASQGEWADLLLQYDIPGIYQDIHALQAQDPPDTSRAEGFVPQIIGERRQKPEDCISDVIRYNNILTTTVTPFHIGTEVTFVRVCGGEIGIQLDTFQNGGFTTAVYVLEDVELNLLDYEFDSNRYDIVDPQFGARAYIDAFYDFQNELGDTSFGEDGIYDVLYLNEVRQWSKREVRMMELTQEFYQEAIAEGFIYNALSGDCPPNRFLMDGQPARYGPYGRTFLVPPQGGTLTAIADKDFCWDGVNGYKFNVFVKPGQIVSFNYDEFVAPINEQGPYWICSAFSWVVPGWQPEGEVPNGCDLYPQYDASVWATMSRMGYHRADTRFGDDSPAGYRVFVWWGSAHMPMETALPTGHWERIVNRFEPIDLEDDGRYSVTITQTHAGPQPVFNFVGAPHTDGATDIPWYTWETPLVFYPTDRLDRPFDWYGVEIFRVTRAGFNGPIFVEKYIIE